MAELLVDSWNSSTTEIVVLYEPRGTLAMLLRLPLCIYCPAYEGDTSAPDSECDAAAVLCSSMHCEVRCATV